MAAERIPNAIAKYIAPYMVHHSLDRDTMLLRYIEVMKMEYKLNYINVSTEKASSALFGFHVGILVRYVSADT